MKKGKQKYAFLILLTKKKNEEEKKTNRKTKNIKAGIQKTNEKKKDKTR